MRSTTEQIQTAAAIAEIIAPLSHCFKIYVSRSYITDVQEVTMDCQATNQQEVKAIRRALGSQIWNKQHIPSLGWWEYSTTINGVFFKIYACREAPPTCLRITEEITVKELVPVAFEEREVVKTIERWDCGSRKAA